MNYFYLHKSWFPINQRSDLSPSCLYIYSVSFFFLKILFFLFLPKVPRYIVVYFSCRCFQLRHCSVSNCQCQLLQFQNLRPVRESSSKKDLLTFILTVSSFSSFIQSLTKQSCSAPVLVKFCARSFLVVVVV